MTSGNFSCCVTMCHTSKIAKPIAFAVLLRVSLKILYIYQCLFLEGTLIANVNSVNFQYCVTTSQDDGKTTRPLDMMASRSEQRDSRPSSAVSTTAVSTTAVICILCHYVNNRPVSPRQSLTVLPRTTLSSLSIIISLRPHGSTRSSDVVTLARQASSYSLETNNNSFRYALPSWAELEFRVWGL